MKAELLAPAGSWESLEAALLAGADAVYLGGNRFGARAYADNLSAEQLPEAIDLCHLQKKSLYLTVNTLLKERELRGELYEYLAPLYEAGLDAVIVQDLGVFRFIRREFPGLPIHASTQMTVHSYLGAKFLAEEGASRVVLSRELSLSEIREVHRQTGVELEAFVHGALCYCYSGQCLFSSMIGGRSGNRGRCAQPCRLPYRFEGGENLYTKEKYLLSPKDICTLEILPDILEAGVFSLKIEGRMKKPAYTAEVTRIYRKYLDLYEEKGKKGWKVEPDDLQDLMDLYNRGGFSGGYYQVRNGKEMMSVDCPGHYGTPGAKVLENRKGILKLRALEDLHSQDMLEDYTLKNAVPEGTDFCLRVSEKRQQGEILRRTRNAALLEEIGEFLRKKPEQEKINGKLIIEQGKSAILILRSRGLTVKVSGDPIQPARNMGLTEEKLLRQMKRTGNTPFCFENLEIVLEEGCFLTVQSLNDLRRRGIEELTRAILETCRRKLPENSGSVLSMDVAEGKKQAVCDSQAGQACEKDDRDGFIPVLTASVQTEEQLFALLPVPGIRRIYLDTDSLYRAVKRGEAARFQELCHQAGKECWLMLPRLFRRDILEEWKQKGAEDVLPGYDGLLFRNLEEYSYIKEAVLDPGHLKADFPVYLFNREAKEFWREHGIDTFTASVELNSRELADVGCGDTELLVYGRLPLMVSAQCLFKTCGKCTGIPGVSYLKDRRGVRFPVRNFCHFCQNTIYNSAPVVLLDSKSEVIRLRPASLRLSFTIESGQEAAKIAGQFESVFLKEEELAFAEDFTRGHFKRGVE